MELSRSVPFGILISITIINCLVTSVFNFKLAKFAKKRSGKTTERNVLNILLFCLGVCHLVISFTAIPFHILTLVGHAYKYDSLCDISCLCRYFTTFSCSTFSMILLTLLHYHRRDQVTEVPFGRQGRVHRNNLHKILIISVIASILPVMCLTSGYIAYMVMENIKPCYPGNVNKNKAHYNLGLGAGVHFGVSMGTALTIVLRSTLSIKKVLRERLKKDNRKISLVASLKKVDSARLYVVAFLVLWVPMALLTLFASVVPSERYTLTLDIGYTCALASFGCVPVVYALTDRNFMNYMKGRIDTLEPKNNNDANQLARSLRLSVRYYGKEFVTFNTEHIG